MDDAVVHTSFSEYLQDHLKRKNVSVLTLAKNSDIQEGHVRALVEGDFQRLPAKPYVRGYIQSIASTLHVPFDELWALYQSQAAPITSGPTDALPKNRFSIQKKHFRLGIVGGLFLLLILGYAVFNGDRLFGRPDITITYPITERITTAMETIILQGRIDPGDKLLINDEVAQVNVDGAFMYEYALEPGLNTIVFKVERFLGRNNEVVRQIFYEPPIFSDDPEEESEELESLGEDDLLL